MQNLKTIRNLPKNENLQKIEFVFSYNSGNIIRENLN